MVVNPRAMAAVRRTKFASKLPILRRSVDTVVRVDGTHQVRSCRSRSCAPTPRNRPPEMYTRPEILSRVRTQDTTGTRKEYCQRLNQLFDCEAREQFDFARKRDQVVAYDVFRVTLIPSLFNVNYNGSALRGK